MSIIYWEKIYFKDYPVIIAWTNQGLCYVGSFIETMEHFLQWQRKNLPGYEVQQSLTSTIYNEQFGEYFAKQRQQFNLPLHIIGTAFQQTVWDALMRIPYGVTTSYSDIANIIKNEKAVRAVARAIGQNPLTIVVPCHRVIGKNGALTGFRGGLEMKQQLLLHEN